MKKKVYPSPRVRRVLMEIGENIKLARLRRQLSLQVVAERSGVSVNTIASLEKGQPGVSLGVTANVLHTLGLAEDIGLLAKDDNLGRKLQDLQLVPKNRAPKKRASIINNSSKAKEES
jgi:transcriptional regulator with XRE-family HTH domain